MLRELGNHEHRYIACAESRVVAAPSSQDALGRHPSARAINPIPCNQRNLWSSWEPAQFITYKAKCGQQRPQVHKKRKMPKSSWFRVTVHKIQQLKRTIGSTSLDGPPPTCFWQTSNFKKQIQFYFLYSSLPRHSHVYPIFSFIDYFILLHFILLK